MSAGYTRVMPRDLFNEAKLLKGWGRLSLLIHDEMAFTEGLTIHHDTECDDGYTIVKIDSSGDLMVENLTLAVMGDIIKIASVLNSNEKWTLYFESKDGVHEGEVFNDHGNFSAEFIIYLSQHKAEKSLQLVAP